MASTSAKVLLIFVIVISLCFDASLLFQSKVVTGIDGYYYGLQIESLLNQGHLYFPTSTPLVIYILTGFSWLFGDVALGSKIAALAFQAFSLVGVGLLVKALTDSTWLAVLSIFLFEYSVLHLYFLSEFISNLGAFSFLIWGSYFLLRGFQVRKVIWFIPAALLILASSLSHYGTFWLSVCGLFVTAYVKAWKASSSFRYPLIVFAWLLFVTPFLLSWQSFLTLSKVFSDELARQPQIPFHNLVMMESLMLAIVCTSCFILLGLKPNLVREKFATCVLFSISLFSSLVLLNPFLGH